MTPNNDIGEQPQLNITMSLGDPNNSGSSLREGRLPTGITILDEEVLKGIPEGSTIAILGDPSSESEMMLHSLASTGRNTHYVTTKRPEIGLMDDITRANPDVDKDEMRDSVTLKSISTSPDSFGDVIRKSLDIVDDGNLIIETMSSKYDESKEMLGLVGRIIRKTKRNKGLTYLYFVAEDTDSLTRNEKEMLQMVDGVFNIKTELVGENVENNLVINKLRGINLPGEVQSLVYGERITIDATSDIG